MKTIKNIFGLIFLVYAASSCTKKIEYKLDPVDPLVAVEGQIVEGMPPIVILSETQAYFGPTDANALFNSFIHNADVRVNDGNQEFQLMELCSDALPDSVVPVLATMLGLDTASLKYFSFCVYTSLNQASFGVQGRTYDLTITTGNKNITASTYVPYKVSLDSTWFEAQQNLDSLGFMWATLTDPPQEGNCYRWAAQRINSYTYGSDSGRIKDPTMVTPMGSVTDDQFFNGLTFNFDYNRGKSSGSNSSEDPSEHGYFKRGDTVVIQFSSIPFPVFKYIRSLESQAASAGSPFASPGNLEYNVQGDGLGIWAGYVHSYDTVICN